MSYERGNQHTAPPRAISDTSVQIRPEHLFQGAALVLTVISLLLGTWLLAAFLPTRFFLTSVAWVLTLVCWVAQAAIRTTRHGRSHASAWVPAVAWLVVVVLALHYLGWNHTV